MARRQHMSRLAAPKTWPVLRKTSKWIAKCSPGPHNLNNSMPLIIILRDILSITRNTKEVKHVLNEGKILINGKPCKDKRFPVGLFDVISVPDMKKNYRVIFNKKGKLSLIEISDSDANQMLLKVRNKTVTKKNQSQVNFDNGWNLLVKDNKDLKPNDSVLFDVKNKKMSKHIGFSKDKVVFIVGGRHIGNLATIKEITDRGTKGRRIIVLNLLGKEETWETTLNNLVVVGDKKSELMLTKE